MTDLPNALVSTVGLDNDAYYKVELCRSVMFIDGKPRLPSQQHVMTGELVRWIDDRNPGAISALNPA